MDECMALIISTCNHFYPRSWKVFGSFEDQPRNLVRSQAPSTLIGIQLFTACQRG